MFGIPKNVTDAGKRGIAGVGIIGNLLTSGAVPPSVKSNTNGTKQLSGYSKHVRLEETGRDIKRAISTGTRVNNTQKLAGTQQISRKDLKILKKK